MKKYSALIFSLISIFLVISCNINLNEFENSTSESSGTLNIPEGKSLVTVNFSLFNSTSKVAAIPDFSSLDIEKYVVTAKADGQTTQTQEVTAESTAANIILANGIEWTIIIEGKNLSDKVIVKGEKKFTPTAESNSTTVPISPYQQTSKDGIPIPGSIKLNIEFSQSDSSIRVDWYIDGTLQGTVNADLHSSNVTKVFESSSIEPGTHRITLNIFNSNEPSEVIIKIYDLVVYSNMESKLWHDNGTPEEKITMTSDDIMPVTLADCAFYVLGTGATNLNGTEESVALKVGKKKAFKFATVQDAVDAIVNVDPNGKYLSNIYVDGSISVSPEVGVTSIVKVGNGTNTPHIAITGIGSAAIRRSSESPNPARIFYVSRGADLTVVDVDISGGKTSTDSTDCNGGGIYCSGKVTYSGNISDCEATYGGGICTNGSESNVADVTFEGTIDSCKSSNSGAAIYIDNFSNVSLNDTDILNNISGKSGGGIYVTYAGSGASFLSMNGGSFVANRAEGGNGGGVAIYSRRGSNPYPNCYVKDVTFDNNYASGSGGAVNIVSTSYFGMINCITKNNTAGANLNGVNVTGDLLLFDECYVEDNITSNGNIRIDSSLKPVAGKTIVSKIAYTPYETGKTVLLKNNSNANFAEQINYFTLSNPNWQIDANGKLKKMPVEESSGQITFENYLLNFSIDKTLVTSSSDTVGVSLTVTDSSGIPHNYTSSDLSTVIDSLSIKVFCDGTEINSSNVSGFNIGNGVITIPASMPDDNYRIAVNGIFSGNGQGISTNMYFKVQR